MRNISLSIVFFVFVFISCDFSLSGQPVKTGLEVLTESSFTVLEGKRVGLITNPTGVNRDLISAVDILYNAKNVDLVALFGPEHGVRGDYSAGEKVSSMKDEKTGLPVFSLYGKTRKPTSDMLKGIDVLVYDIQDIGSRSYTYISSMGLAMEAAVENNIEFIVLDRPNPLGGNKVEGPLVEPEFISFVSQFPIPYVHGLTCGELATYLNEEGLLAKGAKCELSVIPMEGWDRSMIFEETGLPWVLSSPHIPHRHSPYYYPVSGILGELYVYNIGVGYTLPFQLIAATWVDAEALTNALNDLNLPGIIFRPVHFKPYYSVSKGETVHGVQIHLMDPGQAPLSLIQFYVLQECYKLWPDKNVFELCDPSRLNMFDKVCGSDKIRKKFSASFKVESIIDAWQKDIEPFKAKVKKHLIYL
ncbi:exo-beta-N-acetylmuramidase NamZ domain-containing protein [Bacteroidota bacterium]